MGGTMRIRTAALAAVILCLPLTACGNGDAEDKPKAATSSFDCTTQDTTQAEWMKHCADKTADEPQGVSTKPMALGKAVETAGSLNPVNGPGGGVLELGPTTITYAKKATEETPEHDLFAIVTYKARSTKAVDAAESAPIENGGWEWVAPDGQAVDTLSGNATNVTPDGHNGGGTVQSGTYQWRSIAFDITTAQQGGTLTYTDGDGTTWRWTMPAKDSGPELAKLKAALD